MGAMAYPFGIVILLCHAPPSASQSVSIYTLKSRRQYSVITYLNTLVVML